VGANGALVGEGNKMFEPSGGEAVGRETNSTKLKPGGQSASTVASKQI
jgi:hypothetical protein